MLNRIKQFFGIGPGPDFAQIIKSGAIILDVRSKNEFTSGHIQGSVNISVDSLQNNLNKLKDKNKAIITCCASGMRSSAAKSILESHGYTRVYNGGSWTNLQNKIK